jgi:hypothetical protein
VHLHVCVCARARVCVDGVPFSQLVPFLYCLPPSHSQQDAVKEVWAEFLGGRSKSKSPLPVMDRNSSGIS